MVATNARDVLKKENEFLDRLIETATTYCQNESGITQQVFDGWIRGLRRHHDINTQLIGHSSDADFDQDVKEEIELLDGVIKTMKGGGTVTQSWVDHLNDDIELLKKLL